MLSRLADSQWSANLQTSDYVGVPLKNSLPRGSQQLFSISFKQWRKGFYSQIVPGVFRADFFLRTRKSRNYRDKAFCVLSSVMRQSLIYTQQPLITFLCSAFLCFSVFICYRDSLFSCDTKTSPTLVGPPTWFGTEFIFYKGSSYLLFPWYVLTLN